ncbi:MAG TPA: hypothetical protein VGD84_08515 [Pseudonocardiaceae bacterium]
MWRVVKALLQVPRLHELSERNLVVRMLADVWGGPVPVQEHARAVVHLFSLVEACRSRPRGLDVLVEILDEIDYGSTHIADVRRVVEPMIVLEMWPDDERERLFALLDGVAIPDVVELYRAAAGQWAPELRPRATYRDAFAMLETLTGGPDGVPRAVIFVELLASLVRPDLALRLRQWSDRQAGLIGVAEELRAARQRPPLAGGRSALPTKPAPHASAYLVLLVQQEGVDGDTYRLSHWRQLDASGEWLPDRGLDYQGDLDGVRRAVAHLMESLEAEWASYQPNIFVEFVLPEELLNLDVDQWAWDTDPRMPEPIGCHFPVVIRSLERMTKQKWHRPWYLRWRELQDQLANHGAIAPGSDYWSTAGNTLRTIMSAFEQQPKLVALVPSAPPNGKTSGADEVAVGFRKGVPVMVWHRENCRSQAFVSAVLEMLHGDDPHDVLERVRLVRLNGFAAGTDVPHVGTHITLLWDDPGRKVTPEQPGPPTRVAVS